MVRRLGASVSIGALVGVFVAALFGIPALSGPWSVAALLANAGTFWGGIFGGFAGLATTGLVFALLARRDRRASRWGRYLAALVLAVLSFATTMWIVMWGFTPFTLEGMWIYPLAILPAVAAYLLLRRKRVRFWDEPPKSRPEEGIV